MSDEEVERGMETLEVWYAWIAAAKRKPGTLEGGKPMTIVSTLFRCSRLHEGGCSGGAMPNGVTEKREQQLRWHVTH